MVFVVAFGISQMLALAEVPANTCSVDALHVCLVRLNHDVLRSEVERILPRHGEMASFEEIAQASEIHFQLKTAALRWPGAIETGSSPAIIQVKLPSQITHFVVVVEAEPDRVHVVDQNFDGWLTWDRLRAMGWDGAALHLSNARLPMTRWRSPVFLLSGLFLVTSVVLLAMNRHRAKRSL